jgi:hypothetical protein
VGDKSAAVSQPQPSKERGASWYLSPSSPASIQNSAESWIPLRCGVPTEIRISGGDWGLGLGAWGLLLRPESLTGQKTVMVGTLWDAL